jgi:hypothetical protein
MVTFGGTGAVNDALGVGNMIDRDSGAEAGEVAGFANRVLMAGAGGAAKDGPNTVVKITKLKGTGNYQIAASISKAEATANLLTQGFKQTVSAKGKQLITNGVKTYTTYFSSTTGEANAAIKSLAGGITEIRFW